MRMWRIRNFKRRSYFLSLSIKFRHFLTSLLLYFAETTLARRQSLVIHLYKYAEVTCVGREILRNKKYRKYLRETSLWGREEGSWNGEEAEVVGRREGALAFKNELGNFITF